MQIDIQTTQVKPLRQTFSFVARRLGADKPASRYQEATLDMQPEANFHYRPLWEPDRELYDKRRTAIVMEDWYAFKDPRHYYYGVYVMARARQQDAAEKHFEFIEKLGLLAAAPEALRQQIAFLLVPLRHYEWGANMNNCYVSGWGYGAAVTQATTFAAMDRLGIAQYLTRIGLLLGPDGAAVLDQGRQDWLQAPAWQGVRRELENLFVQRDWFEVFLAQNLVFDGLLYPLVYQHARQVLGPATGNALSLVTGFMDDWYEENARWIDATVRVAAEESPANAERLSAWARHWSAAMHEALGPVALAALGADGRRALDEVHAAFKVRAARLGLSF